MPQDPIKQELKAYATRKYEHFESNGMTIGQAIDWIEDVIQSTKESIPFLQATRNDMSTHLGAPDDLFDRNKHTHNFANI